MNMRRTPNPTPICQPRIWVENAWQCARMVRLGFRKQKSKPIIVLALGIVTVIAIASGAYMGAALEDWIRAPSSFSIAASLADYSAYLGRALPPFCAASKELCLAGHLTKRVLREWMQATGRELLEGPVQGPCLHEVPQRPGAEPYKGSSSVRNDSSGRENSSGCNPIQIFFDDKVYQWPEDADVLVFNLAVSMGTIKPQAHQVRAVLNMEAHSVRKSLMADADLLVSFHREADVQVSYAYTLVGNTPCRRTNRTAACLEQGGGWCSVCGSRGREAASARSAEAFLAASMNYIPSMRRIQSARGSVAGASAPMATFMSASCDRHGGYLERLMQHIRIDSYGRCFSNKKEVGHPAWELLRSSEDEAQRTSLRPSDRIQAKMLISASYKFYLAIENTILPDYVTEKFYNGFMTPAVMVYLGAPNARDYAPANHSFIDALDFASPQHLAQYLQRVAADHILYRSYTLWRQSTEPMADNFLCAVGKDLTLMDAGSVMCRTCAAARRRRASAPPARCR